MRDYPALLVGLGRADDAAVYRISDEVAIIQTVDFFTPVVDDPYTYGAIAAANAMSDVYAMGGEVILALNVAAFPPKLPGEILAEIFRGGADKVKEAGGVIAGGHTVDDEEPKYGLCVTGVIHPDKVRTKGGARPGDALVLTKPLGLGLVATASKGGVADPAHMAEAVSQMAQLSRRASQALQSLPAGVHAVTDITGFALLGHGAEMAEQSQARLQFDLDRLPLVPGALEYADQWLFPAGTCRNESYYEHLVRWGPTVSEEVQQLLYTPETSGGLLAAVAPGRLTDLEAAFRAVGQAYWVVGEVVEGMGIEVA